MTVLLVTNPTKDSGYAVTGQAAALLHELGVAVVMAQPVFESKVPIRFLPEEEAYREADFVITIGGDGTLLKAGLDCVHYGKPVLGLVSHPLAWYLALWRNGCAGTSGLRRSIILFSTRVLTGSRSNVRSTVSIQKAGAV